MGGLCDGQGRQHELRVRMGREALDPQPDLDLDAGRVVDLLVLQPEPVGGLRPRRPVEGDDGHHAWRGSLAGQPVGGLPRDVAEEHVDLEALLDVLLPFEEGGLERLAERADGVGEDVIEHARLRLPGACEPGAVSGNEKLGLIIVAASFVVFVVWLIAARAVVRHQPEIHPGPATMDLGPESPAVVNHVVHRRLTANAVPATLLDLAARGWAEVFAPHQGATMVQVADGAASQSGAPHHLRDPAARRDSEGGGERRPPGRAARGRAEPVDALVLGSLPDVGHPRVEAARARRSTEDRSASC